MKNFQIGANSDFNFWYIFRIRAEGIFSRISEFISLSEIRCNSSPDFENNSDRKVSEFLRLLGYSQRSVRFKEGTRGIALLLIFLKWGINDFGFYFVTQLSFINRVELWKSLFLATFPNFIPTTKLVDNHFFSMPACNLSGLRLGFSKDSFFYSWKFSLFSWFNFENSFLEKKVPSFLHKSQNLKKIKIKIILLIYYLWGIFFFFLLESIRLLIFRSRHN